MIEKATDLVAKLKKRKETFEKIIGDKQASLLRLECFIKDYQGKVPQGSLEKYEKTKDRLEQYQEHLDLLKRDLALIESNEDVFDADVMFMWDFYEAFVQSSKYVQVALEEKQKLMKEAKKSPMKFKVV